jgi:hypothetical protein
MFCGVYPRLLDGCEDNLDNRFLQIIIRNCNYLSLTKNLCSKFSWLILSDL